MPAPSESSPSSIEVSATGGISQFLQIYSPRQLSSPTPASMTQTSTPSSTDRSPQQGMSLEKHLPSRRPLGELAYNTSSAVTPPSAKKPTMEVKPRFDYATANYAESSSPDSTTYVDAATTSPTSSDARQDITINESIVPIIPSGPRALTRARVPRAVRIQSPTHTRGSVKHLTCFWWKDKGGCRFTEDDCLYAHHDTGLYTDPPRQVIPGQPALAGRSLDRALKKLRLDHQRSSSSLSTMSISQPPTPSVAVMPSISAAIMPATNLDHSQAYAQLASVLTDNNWLRTLVDQNGREKQMMMNNVEALQKENHGRSLSLTVQDPTKLTSNCRAQSQYQQIADRMRHLDGRAENLTRQHPTTRR